MNAAGEDNNSALRIAAIDGHLDVIILLIASGKFLLPF